MKSKSSRREFLAAGLSLPVAGIASITGLESGTTISASKPSSGSSGVSYRTLGKTGLKVSTVGFGCAFTPDGSVIERAADLGINCFDTARDYQGGNNERMVGAALKRKRKDIVLSTKSHLRSAGRWGIAGGPITPGRRTMGVCGSTSCALGDLDKSLRELGTDYVDIWCLHAKHSPEEVTDDLIEAQQIAKRQGKIRFAGLSTHAPQKMLPWLVEKGTFEVVLVTYNFTMDKKVGAALEQASKAGMGVVAMKVMAGGYRKVKPGDPGHSEPKRDGTMLAALKWVLRNTSVHTAIPSMTDMDQLEENLKAMAEPYTADDEKLLTRQLEFISPLYCRMCGKCEGSCVQGLPVADILRYLTYAEGCGQFAWGREKFLELPREVAEVRCSQCPGCTVTCEFGVQVANRLSRAQELFA